MDITNFEVESFTTFSESLIWDLNRDFYHNRGIDAWSKGIVPHQITSNSLVGKTYAELILGFLKDLADKGDIHDTVYILELGAGHGRLGFHILKHLQKLMALVNVKLPPYCYILSDIVEDNLLFFKDHPQLQTYFRQGVLDFAYFDGTESKEMYLQYAGIKISSQDLNQPIVAVANYFFDSIPNDLFLIQDQNISACTVALQSNEDPQRVDSETLIKNLRLTYQKTLLLKPFYADAIANEILEDYRNLVSATHLFFPQKSMECLNSLADFSKKGLMILSMDKGFHEIHDLDHKQEPEIITHGSFSLWVNYHALGKLCLKKGGRVLFPEYSSFHIQLGCLLFLKEGDTYQYTHAAYQRFVNDFGPDDFNSLKKLAYRNISKLTMTELLALIRLSAYDSTFFVKILSRLRKISKSVTIDERRRLAQTLHQVWDLYFNIDELDNLAFELGGFFYDLGFHQEALTYFEYAGSSSGQKADIYYNQILCYYQLRKDDLFSKTLIKAKAEFPDNTIFEHLDTLDLAAV